MQSCSNCGFRLHLIFVSYQIVFAAKFLLLLQYSVEVSMPEIEWHLVSLPITCPPANGMLAIWCLDRCIPM